MKYLQLVKEESQIVEQDSKSVAYDEVSGNVYYLDAKETVENEPESSESE